MSQLPLRVARALERFVSHAASAPAGLDRVVLFGSYARGDFRGDSDIDLLALVDRRDPELLDWLYDGVLEAQLRDRVDLSLKVIPRRAYEEMLAQGEPFAGNVAREGRDLWKRSPATVSAAT